MRANVWFSKLARRRQCSFRSTFVGLECETKCLLYFFFLLCVKCLRRFACSLLRQHDQLIYVRLFLWGTVICVGSIKYISLVSVCVRLSGQIICGLATPAKGSLLCSSLSFIAASLSTEDCVDSQSTAYLRLYLPSSYLLWCPRTCQMTRTFIACYHRVSSTVCVCVCVITLNQHR